MATKLIESKLLAKFPQLKHGFFTRLGGLSSGLYESLNFGFGSKDDPKIINKNYQIAADYLGIPADNMITVKQIHSNICIDFDDSKKLQKKYYEADALITKKRNIALCSLTADCVPILLYAKDIDYIGAIHAGWRGAFTGIIQNTVDKLISHGAKPENIHAAIMPAISQESYEIDQSFYQNFMEQNSKNEKYFSLNEQEKYQFDLKLYEYDILKSLEINNIDLIDIDTYKRSDICFSYRRATHQNQTDMGRHISFIMLS